MQLLSHGLIDILYYSVNQALFCDTYCEKTALMKQLQQLAEGKNILQHQLLGTEKEADNLVVPCTSKYVMDSEQQRKELKHDPIVTLESEDHLETQRYRTLL